MKLWWPEQPWPGNVGDLITPWLYEKDTGKRPERGERGSAGVVMGCGSIAAHAGPGSIVWGSGCLQETDIVDGGADIRALRGPLTQNRTTVRQDVPLGDPGLLVKRFFRPLPIEVYSIKRDYVVVPHYVDGERARALFHRHAVISPLTDVDSFLDCIYGWDLVASSSLHGIVLAHALGIRAAWLEFGPWVSGHGFKFRDYGLSVGIEMEPVDMRHRKKAPTYEEIAEHATLPRSLPDLDALWEARPWKA